MVYNQLRILVVCAVCAGSLVRAQSAPVGPVRALDETSYFGGVPVYPPYVPGGLQSYAITNSLPLTATLTATLHAGGQGMQTSGYINISAVGIGAGTYTVKSIMGSGGGTFLIGSLAEVTGTVPITPRIGYFPSTPIGTPVSPILFPPVYTTGSAVFGSGGIPFPAGFDPFNISMLSISDSNGTVIANSTITPVSNGVYSAYSMLNSNRFRRRPIGSVHVMSSISNQVEYGTLMITGERFPRKTNLIISADGVDVGYAKTDVTGDLEVIERQGSGGTLPAALDLFSVKVVTLTELSGRVVASAQL